MFYRHRPAPGAPDQTVQRWPRPVTALLIGLASLGAQANPLNEAVAAFVQQHVDRSYGRATVEVGSPDARLALAPCQRIEPYALTGSRLWGRSAVGVRCLQGANWAITVPVTVTVHGSAWVVEQALPAGSRVDPKLVRQDMVELTREPGTPVRELSQLHERILARRLQPGEILRIEQFKAAVTIQTGDPVRIQLLGAQFQINSDGFALHPGSEGQALRVRTEGGRVVSGTLRGRTVEVLL